MFNSNGIDAIQLISSLLIEHDESNPAADAFITGFASLLDKGFASALKTRDILIEWAFKTVTQILQDEMCDLMHVETGFHFNAAKTTQTKLKDFTFRVSNISTRTSAGRVADAT
ncbi:hypothetical protein BDQ12DRAFT_723388 [Crucibulum laeve]|uniref:Uncharacterized protein n=1 Tax=Crucibulum laeve TaxID=68775 RepID=A0A5C3MBP1_9AGAR|nr:hypothetical protein BDQ12DRAFT_723388 [Crucibulum laeve]